MKKFVDKKELLKRILSVIMTIALLAIVFMGGYFTYYLTLDKDISSLIWLKKIIQNNYITDDVSDEDFMKALTDGLNDYLDTYSEYYDADTYSTVKEQNGGNYKGIGVSFAYGDDYLIIFKVKYNSPAYHAGIKEGMRVSAYGENASNLIPYGGYSDFAQWLSAYEDEKDFTLSMAYDEGGSEVNKNFILKKTDYTESYVSYSSSDSAYVFTGESLEFKPCEENIMPSLPKDTAYIRLTAFSGDAAYQMETALNKFKQEGKKNLVLDLRNNGGGNLSILESISSYFVKNTTEKKPVCAIATYKDGKTYDFTCQKNAYYDYFSSESKISVLANANTASASECLLGVMIEYGALSYSDLYLSKVNGTAKTYGKGIMQTTYTNAMTGEAIKITTAKLYWPVSRSKCIHGVGVTTSDGAKGVETPYYVTYGDSELNKVIEMIKASI